MLQNTVSGSPLENATLNKIREREYKGIRIKINQYQQRPTI